MSEQANVSLVLSLYEAFRRGDIPAILNTLDPQVSWKVEGPASIPYSGVTRGLEGPKQFFATIGSTTDQISLDMAPFAAQGDNVVTAGRYQARVIATGRRFDVPLVHLFTIRNGKVVRYVNMSDSGTVAEAYAATAANA
ncbi:MAG TPA: nuclear transport factor 2 family protein [Bryobacteraceae bacterium]|nr:nuclear transport factor 2 family protein [Bryobacteraceae bacterium]